MFSERSKKVLDRLGGFSKHHVRRGAKDVCRHSVVVVRLDAALRHRVLNRCIDVRRASLEGMSGRHCPCKRLTLSKQYYLDRDPHAYRKLPYVRRDMQVERLIRPTNLPVDGFEEFQLRELDARDGTSDSLTLFVRQAEVVFLNPVPESALLEPPKGSVRITARGI